MKTIKNEIRPVGYLTIELSEAEVQSLLSLFEENCLLRRMPFTEIKGLRGDLYNALEKALPKPDITSDK